MLREKDDIVSGSYAVLSFFLRSNVEIAQKTVELGRGNFSDSSFLTLYQGCFLKLSSAMN